MSHFTVMVIGDNPEKQLAPYHEYECTGTDDEYVIDVDCTDEVDEWLAKTIWVGITVGGKLDYQYNKEACEAAGWTDVKEMTWEDYSFAKDMTIGEAVKDYFGYEKKDGKYVNHTNPNAKWDWYQIGGRWSGFLKVKNPEVAAMGEKSWANAGVEIAEDYADVTTKGNIDIAGMEEKARKDAGEQFDHLAAAIGDITPVSWTALRESFEADGKTIDEARDAYYDSDFKRAMRSYEMVNDVRIGGFLGNVYEDFYLHLPLFLARVKYVETAVMNILTPYAFVKDSEWVERGEMGWFGMASNEKDKDEWLSQFYKMFKALPDDTLITMVDCHI